MLIVKEDEGRVGDDYLNVCMVRVSCCLYVIIIIIVIIIVVVAGSDMDARSIPLDPFKGEYRIVAG